MHLFVPSQMPKLLWSDTQPKSLKEEVPRFVHGIEDVLAEMVKKNCTSISLAAQLFSILEGIHAS